MLDRALTLLWRSYIAKGVQYDQRRAGLRRYKAPVATGDWYAPLPFFAKNLPISALVWSPKRCWLFLAGDGVGVCRARNTPVRNR